MWQFKLVKDAVGDDDPLSMVTASFPNPAFCVYLSSIAASRVLISIRAALREPPVGGHATPSVTLDGHVAVDCRLLTITGHLGSFASHLLWTSEKLNWKYPELLPLASLMWTESQKREFFFSNEFTFCTQFNSNPAVHLPPCLHRMEFHCMTLLHVQMCMLSRSITIVSNSISQCVSYT